MIEKKEIAGGIVLNDKNNILIVFNHETNTWGFPKGHIKKYEGKLDAAKREIHEETGITKLKLIRELEPYERFTLQKKDKIKIMNLFIFRTDEKSLKSNTKDITSLKWISLDEAKKYFTYKEDFETVKNHI